MSMKKKAVSLLAAAVMCSTILSGAAMPAYAASTAKAGYVSAAAQSESRPLSVSRLNTLIQDKTVVGVKSKVTLSKLNDYYAFIAPNGEHITVTGVQVMVYDMNGSRCWTNPKGDLGTIKDGYCTIEGKNTKNMTFGGVDLWNSREYAYQNRYFKLALAPVRYNAPKHRMTYAKEKFYSEAVWYDIIDNCIVSDPT